MSATYLRFNPLHRFWTPRDALIPLRRGLALNLFFGVLVLRWGQS